MIVFQGGENTAQLRREMFADGFFWQPRRMRGVPNPAANDGMASFVDDCCVFCECETFLCSNSMEKAKAR